MKAQQRGTSRHRHVLAVCLLAVSASHVAAGGHFDVDDAGTLAEGQCQYETWASRTHGGVSEPDTALHFGPACRIGPVELGFNADRFSGGGGRHTVLLGPQLKWTFFGQASDAVLSSALFFSVSADVTHGGRMGGQAVVPITWHATRTLQIHANFGADWSPGTGSRTRRFGLASEWALSDVMSLIAERDRAFDQWTSRIGARFSIAPLTTLDVSAARTGPAGLRTITVGLNQEFSRH